MNNESPSQESFARFIYEDLREKWKHEDELIHQRITRLLTSQAFFLGAHGILVSLRLKQEYKTALDSQIISLPFGETTLNPFTLAAFCLPFIGLAICRDTRLGIYAAFEAMEAIKGTYKTRSKDIIELNRYPDVDVALKHSQGGIQATKNIPGVFIVCWLLILIYEILKVSSIKT